MRQTSEDVREILVATAGRLHRSKRSRNVPTEDSQAFVSLNMLYLMRPAGRPRILVFQIDEPFLSSHFKQINEKASTLCMHGVHIGNTCVNVH